MGANEKHNATYHGREYTLDSTYVRTVFGLKANTPTCSVNPEILWTERTKQFDRWLETVRAEAWDEGAMASESLSCENPPCGVCEHCGTPLVNPYT